MWKFIVLDLDESSREIYRVFSGRWEKITELSKLNGGIRNKKDLREEFKKIKANEQTLFLSGNSKYHYYTYGICTGLIDRISDQYCYMHIDNHHDDMETRFIEVGGFVSSIIEDSNASEGFYVGCSPRNNSKFNFTSISQDELKGGSFDKIKNINCEKVYISIDLDVLKENEIETGDFTRGDLNLSDIENLIENIKKNKNILGCDIFGYASISHLKSLLSYTQLAGTITNKNIEDLRFLRKCL